MNFSQRDIKAKAIYFLARRDYAYKEILNKLLKYFDDSELIKQVLDQLKLDGYLSEERFIESYIHAKSKKYGALKIKQGLLQKGSPVQEVSKAICSLAHNEHTTALAIWQRKFGFLSSDNKDIAKQIRFMQNRGFSFECIKKILQLK